MDYGIIKFLDDLGLVWKYALNGLIGAIVWSIYKKSKFTEALRQIVIGAIVSGYFTPVIVSKTGMDLAFIGSTSFIVGMMGIVIIDSIYKYFVDKIKKWKEAMVFINTKSTKK